MTFSKYFRNITQRGFQLVKAVAVVLVVLTTCTIAAMLPFPVKLISQYHHFSPIQKYWFTTYLRTEFSPRERGVYRVLVVEDVSQQYWIAGPDNVQPGSSRRANGQEIPFILAKKEEQEGKRLRLLPPMPQANGYLWELLRDEVYNGKSIKEIGVSGIDTGVRLTLLAYVVLFVGCLVLLFFRVSAIMDRMSAEKAGENSGR
jgi:hypothetical protein